MNWAFADCQDGFTDEKLDFIINDDIKYRMGQDGGDEEDAD